MIGYGISLGIAHTKHPMIFMANPVRHPMGLNMGSWRRVRGVLFGIMICVYKELRPRPGRPPVADSRDAYMPMDVYI